METLKTKKLATGGVLLALSAATLFGASFIPGIELTLFALSSVYVVIMIIEFSPGAGWLFYFASILLAFVLVPNKIGIIPYVIFFGIYAFVKYYIEKSQKLPQAVEIILKLVVSNLLLFLGFLGFGTAFTGTIQLPDAALPVLAAGAQVFILAYDCILTLVIGFYLKRRPKR
jgi:hypothetical protein